MTGQGTTPAENLPPTEPELTPGIGELVDLQVATAEVLQLEDYLLRRLLLESPRVVPVTFGQSGVNNAEQTIAGDQRDPFNGVAILNPTPAIVYVGFQAGGAVGSSVVVLPGSYLVLPRRYANLSLAVGATDNAGAIALTVTAICLRVPPSVDGGPLGAALSNPQNALNAGTSVVPGLVGLASAVIANPARRSLTITNANASASGGFVTLALGPAIPANGAGIVLPPGGPPFVIPNYGGAVSMISTIAGTVVSIAEV